MHAEEEEEADLDSCDGPVLPLGPLARTPSWSVASRGMRLPLERQRHLEQQLRLARAQAAATRQQLELMAERLAAAEDARGGGAPERLRLEVLQVSVRGVRVRRLSRLTLKRACATRALRRWHGKAAAPACGTVSTHSYSLRWCRRRWSC